MTAAAAASNPLLFAQSESQAVGFTGSLLPLIRNNAPRLVAGLKMAGDIAAGLTFNPFLMAYAGFSIVGRLISIVYGSKSHQQKLAGKTSELGHSWTDSLAKVIHPSQYPVESSAGLSTVGEVFEAAFGASQFFEPGKTGYTALVGGLVAVWSYANMVFGKEKKKDAAADKAQAPLTFAASKSKPVGFLGRVRQVMKGNPVLVSSLMQLSVVTAVLIGGLIEGYDAAYLAYAVIGIVACITQAVFVRKNEFNIEGAQAQAAQKPLTFEEKLAQKRQQEINRGTPV